ncbi:MAG: lipopolysaccharide heptosyltransferase I [Pseudomonadales bacterium]|nr:lipopolysaccharide heptosyltransferase I [Pseudomonadales bacterium]
MRILIVKVSSMGDIIHTLPALTDAFHAKKDVYFDWVVEEAFTEIPGWHPAVDRVIPVAFRRWRQAPYRAWRSGEFQEFRKNLQQQPYDLVLDAQGLIKSGVISALARGQVAGQSKNTIREPLATLFYDRVYTIPWQQHAVERVRALFAQALDYPRDRTSCDYGIDLGRITNKLPAKDNTVVFLHGTSWDSKKWPGQYWQQLARLAGRGGFRVKVLWGNQEELRCARVIAEAAANVEVQDRLSLNGVASVLLSARAIVAVDTGLAHLAAALDLPVVAIYGASNPALTGTYGREQVHLKSSFGCSPCLNKKCRYRGASVTSHYDDKVFQVRPPCYSDNPPELVWEQIMALMKGDKARLDSLSGG